MPSVGIGGRVPQPMAGIIWQRAVKAGHMTICRYADSGLDNVTIEGRNVLADDSGDCVMIPNIKGLRKTIALAIVTRRSSMSGGELRFLRTEMGMTDSELAYFLHRDALTISGWEREQVKMDEAAEAAIRLLAIRQLRLPEGADVGEIAGWCKPSAETPPIVIDGSDNSNYRSKLAP